MDLSTEHSSVVVQWNEKHETYEAHTFEMPNYTVSGRTIEEALKRLQEVLTIVVSAEQKLHSLPADWMSSPGILGDDD